MESAALFSFHHHFPRIEFAVCPWQAWRSVPAPLCAGCDPMGNRRPQTRPTLCDRWYTQPYIDRNRVSNNVYIKVDHISSSRFVHQQQSIFFFHYVSDRNIHFTNSQILPLAITTEPTIWCATLFIALLSSLQHSPP